MESDEFIHRLQRDGVDSHDEEQYEEFLRSVPEFEK